MGTLMQREGPVLVIDDLTIIREATVFFLRSHGFTVATAANGEEGLQRLRAGLEPCAILLDLAMPRKDGLQFRDEQLQDQTLASIPTAAYSADTFLAERARAAGLPFFHKPSDMDKVHVFLDEHCVRDPSSDCSALGSWEQGRLATRRGVARP